MSAGLLTDRLFLDVGLLGVEAVAYKHGNDMNGAKEKLLVYET